MRALLVFSLRLHQLGLQPRWIKLLTSGSRAQSLRVKWVKRQPAIRWTSFSSSSTNQEWWRTLFFLFSYWILVSRITLPFSVSESSELNSSMVQSFWWSRYKWIFPEKWIHKLSFCARELKRTEYNFFIPFSWSFESNWNLWVKLERTVELSSELFQSIHNCESFKKWSWFWMCSNWIETETNLFFFSFIIFHIFISFLIHLHLKLFHTSCEIKEKWSILINAVNKINVIFLLVKLKLFMVICESLILRSGGVLPILLDPGRVGFVVH